jgi:O-antigen ligase
MIARRDNIGTLPGTQLALSTAFAFVASAAILGIFLADKRVVLTIVGATAFVGCFVLSGNQRLFCLWGLLISAPLNLSKNFWTRLHMGGAESISIDFDDVFILLLLAFILRDLALGHRHRLRFSGVAFWLGALVLLGIADIVTGPLRHRPAMEVVRMIKCYLLFFVIVNEVLRVRQFLHVFAALTVGVALEAGIGIVQYLFEANLGLQVLGEADPEITKFASESAYNLAGAAGIFRIGGLLGHPNALSAYLALLLPICLALLFSRISVIAKLAVGAVIGLGAAALVMTLSRSGWLAFVVGFTTLSIVGFVHPRLRGRYVMARLAVVVALLVGVAAFSGPISRRVFESDPGSFNFRYEFMEVAWEMAQEHPILGFGLNTFADNLPGHTRYGGPKGLTTAFGKYWPVVHNTYLITLVEQGVVGFAFFVGLHLYILRLGIGNARTYVNDIVFTMNLGCLAGFLAIMADGIGSFFLRQPAPARVWWIVVAVICACHYWNQANLLLAQAVQRPRANPLPQPSAADDGG